MESDPGLSASQPELLREAIPRQTAWLLQHENMVVGENRLGTRQHETSPSVPTAGERLLSGEKFPIGIAMLHGFFLLQSVACQNLVFHR